MYLSNMALAGVFIAYGAILFIVFCSCASWFVSPAHPQPLSPRRVKGELSCEGRRSSEASTSRGKEIRVSFNSGQFAIRRRTNLHRNWTLTLISDLPNTPTRLQTDIIKK